MNKGSRWPSAALIVSLIALVTALAGSAVALPGKNSVDKNDIKKNAVKSKAIKNGQVKAADVADGSIGAAEIADGSVGAAELTDPEAPLVVGTPGQPVLDNGGDGDCVWTQANTVPTLASVAPVSFYKDPDGRVHLSGIASRANGPGGDGGCGQPGDSDVNRDGVVFILPPAYRPAASEFFFPTGDGGVGAAVLAADLAFGADVVPAGAVVVNAGTGSTGTAALSGISFRAAAPATARANAKKSATKASAEIRRLFR